jgi:hypothetical protein
MARRAAAALLVLAALGGAAGCGAGAGEAPREVRLTVTDGFGARTLLERTGPEVRGRDTVMRLLQRNARVTTRYGGGFVQSIAGLAGGRPGGRPVDWFFYVNGTLADEGAASTEVRAGERIWWDRRDWGVTMRVPAVVGSFPEPFVSGPGDGERLPTRVECDTELEQACDLVQQRLIDRGVPAARSLPGTEGGDESLRVLVGRWPELRDDRALEQLERGPRASGVYARISSDGRRITVLDARGRERRTLGPGTGLIAATRYLDQPPTWVVTGTDPAGVASAARAFDESVLGEKFALAVSADRAVPLPEPSAGAAP